MDGKNKNNYKWWAVALAILVLLISLIGFFRTPEDAGSANGAAGPLRIVSLMPSLTQSIYYLGAQNQLVGCTSYCQTAEEDSVEVVASVMKPNLERIVSLRPDVVLASGMIPEKDIETMRKFGIKVEVFISPKSFKEICAEFLRLGRIVGKTGKAEEIVSDSESRVSHIAENVGRAGGKPKIFIQIGANPIYAVIPNTFMDDYITYCGGVNIAGDLSAGGVGREFVVSRNPDYIFVVTMGISGENEVDQWKLFGQMNAAANDKIRIIDSDIACQPTPVTFIQTLELINKYIAE